MSMDNDAALLLHLARKSGEIALGFFQAQNAVRYKPGNSPVSEADDAIDDFLRESFHDARPDYGWLSEETTDDHSRLDKEHVVIVDPIDGTRGFIDGRPEWCISIAVVREGRPVEAILHCPALERTFCASLDRGLKIHGSDKKPYRNSGKPIVTGSKRVIRILEELPDSPFETIAFIPSLAYRLAMVATGELDGAFARPGASEWDVAAADLILAESGGKITDGDGNSVVYNQENVVLPALTAGTADRHSEILFLAKSNGIIE